jgi:hypothetical protein
LHEVELQRRDRGGRIDALSVREEQIEDGLSSAKTNRALVTVKLLRDCDADGNFPAENVMIMTCVVEESPK